MMRATARDERCWCDGAAEDQGRADADAARSDDIVGQSQTRNCATLPKMSEWDDYKPNKKARQRLSACGVTRWTVDTGYVVSGRHTHTHTHTLSLSLSLSHHKSNALSLSLAFADGVDKNTGPNDIAEGTTCPRRR